MIMTRLFTAMLALSLACAFALGRGSELAAAVVQGAQSGVTLAVSMAGALCLWTGVGHLMEKTGLTGKLAHFLSPVLHRLFPGTRKDTALAGCLSANICANILGLGNAATPMGIQAAKLMAKGASNGVASHELCRLIVLNTASIQLIPATVAAVRSNLGCQTPFDLLPAVWVTSFCSAGAGLLAAWCLGRLWRS